MRHKKESLLSDMKATKARSNQYQFDSNPIEKILSRMNGVKQTAPDRWQARCPAHDDRSPSLGIKELDDGKVLVNCFAGCGAVAILDAVGLSMSELFPTSSEFAPSKPLRYSPRDVVKTLVTEGTILILALRNIQSGEVLPNEDQARVEIAIKAIEKIRGAL